MRVKGDSERIRSRVFGVSWYHFCPPTLVGIACPRLAPKSVWVDRKEQRLLVKDCRLCLLNKERLSSLRSVVETSLRRKRLKMRTAPHRRVVCDKAFPSRHSETLANPAYSKQA